MEDTKNEIPRIVASLAHILCGSHRSHDEIGKKLQMVQARFVVDSLALLRYFDAPEGRDRPLVVMQPHPDDPSLPMFSLAVHHEGKNLVFQECYLWLAPKASRAVLIPSGFDAGSFRFYDDLRFVHDRKAPKKNFDAALPGIARALSRMAALVDEYSKQQNVGSVPQLAKAS